MLQLLNYNRGVNMLNLLNLRSTYAAAVGFAIVSFIYATMITTIPTGYVGIQVLFGKVINGYLEPGMHVVNPFTTVVKMDTRTQKADEEGVIPSKEMLSMTLKTSVNYHIDVAKADEIYKTLGVDYFDKFVDPHIRSSLRQVTSEYGAEQFFSNSRNEIQKKIQESLTQVLGPRKRGVRPDLLTSCYQLFCFETKETVSITKKYAGLLPETRNNVTSARE